MDPDTDTDISRYTEAFLEETEEHIQTLTQALLDFEEEEADAASAAEKLNEAFRAAHTIKGMSASMGFKNMELLCHSLEDVFGELKDSSIGVTPEIIDLLMECSTRLEDMTNHIEKNGNDDIDVSSLLLELKSIRGGEKEEKGEGEEVEKTEVEEITAIKAVEGKGKIFEINVSLDKNCRFKGARGFLVMRNLSEIGEIVTTVPSSQDIEEGRFDFEFKVILTAEVAEADVKKVLSSISEIEKTEISVKEKEKEREEGVAIVKEEEEERVEKKEIKNVRIGIDKLDSIMNLVGELVINKSRLNQIGKEHEIKELSDTMAIVEREITDLQYEVTEMRMITVEHVFNRFPKLVRDLCRNQGKEAEFVMEGKEIELDRTVLDEIVEPLVHLLRNCIDHGIEPPKERERKGKSRKGRIRLMAKREREYVTISIEDDGKGIDTKKLKEKAVSERLISAQDASKLGNEEGEGVGKGKALMLIFKDGLSTTEKATEVSGRGIGMNIVKSKIEALGGAVEVQSKTDIGTKVTLKLPLTTAIIQALLMKVCDKIYAIPLSSVAEIVSVSKHEIKTVHGKKVVMLRDSVLPLVPLRSLFGLPANDGKEKFVVVVVERGDGLIGLITDSVIEQQEVVVKPSGKLFEDVKGLSGFTILGNGKVIPILDVSTLV